MSGRSVQKRLDRLGARLDAAEAQRPEEAASVRWLRVLEGFLPLLQKAPTPDAKAALPGVRESIDRLRWYLEHVRRPDRAWPQVEYHCQGCLLRLGWVDHGWGRRLAFLEEGYAERLRQSEQIDRWRHGPTTGEGGWP